jgi:hypothetical protein
MNNFLLLDNNRIASARQVYAVACKFANIQAKTPSERYGLTKVFNAVVNKFYGDQDAHMTHGEVTDFLGHDVVPKQFLDLVRKPKAVKKSKPKAQTVQQAEIALDINKPKAKAKKSTAENSVAKKLDNRVNALETKVSDMDSKLDAMLKILQAK